MTKDPTQSEEISEEQKLDITTCTNTIDSYLGLEFQDSYTKNVGICGFTGARKTWCMMHCIIFSNSKSPKVTTADMIWKRALQLSGIHVNQPSKIPNEDNLTPHRRAEISILKLTNNSKKIYFKYMLMCWHLMKWVNAQKRLYHNLTSFFVKSGIATYTWVNLLSYVLCIIHISNR